MKAALRYKHRIRGNNICKQTTMHAFNQVSQKPNKRDKISSRIVLFVNKAVRRRCVTAKMYYAEHKW